MEKMRLMEKRPGSGDLPGRLPVSGQLSSVPGHTRTPGPRSHWGQRRLACLFWFGIPQLAGSRGCWSRSNLPQSCEEASSRCKKSSRRWEGLSPLVLRVLESRRQLLARGETGPSRAASWCWWKTGFLRGEATERRSFRTQLCPVLILSWESLFIETLRPGTNVGAQESERNFHGTDDVMAPEAS